jgi:hypothetical protein
MIVGTEWLIEAFDCKAESLRDVETMRNVFAQIISELGLKTIGEGQWHKFGGEGRRDRINNADRIASRLSHLPGIQNRNFQSLLLPNAPDLGLGSEFNGNARRENS